MSQYFPYGKFECFVIYHVTEEWILSVHSDSENCYIFYVYLEYPKHLHKLQNEYVVHPERMAMTEEILTPMRKTCLRTENL